MELIGTFPDGISVLIQVTILLAVCVWIADMSMVFTFKTGGTFFCRIEMNSKFGEDMVKFSSRCVSDSFFNNKFFPSLKEFLRWSWR